MTTHKISSAPLDFDTIRNLIHDSATLTLSSESKSRIRKCREYLDQKLIDNKEQIYGINTGFGALYKKKVSKNDLEKLQRNLVMSHACGTGDEVPGEIVKLMLLLKIQGLNYGNSGVQVETCSG